MKWFKHISDSLDDPDIGEAVVIFGSYGYVVFFRTLEIMAREFDIKIPGYNCFLVEFLRKKYPKSWQKTLNVLEYFHSRKRIFISISNGCTARQIELYCPKLEEMCDEWTKKLLRSKSEDTPVPTPEQEVRSKKKEERRKDTKKHKPFRLPTDEEIGEASLPRLKILIGKTCKDLYECGTFQKANAFANKCLRHKANARAVLYTLIRVSNSKPKNPWAYAVKIMDVEDQNFNERDFNKTT